MRRAAMAGLVCVVASGLAPGASAQAPPLDVAVVVEVAPGPLVASDGRPTARTGEVLEALGDAFTILDRAPVPLTLSVSPVLVSQLRLLGPTAARPYAALLQLVTSRPVLTRPFADVRPTDLPAAADLARQLRTGEAVLRSALNADPVPVLHPPALALDTELLEPLQDAGITQALAASDDLGGRAVRARGMVLLPAGTAGGDGPLADNIAGRNDSPFVVVIDALDPRIGEMAALAADGRLNLVGVAEIAPSPLDGRARFHPVSTPPGGYVQAVRRATAALDAFASYTLDENPVRDTLEMVLGLAASSVHWLEGWERGSALAASVVDRVSEERDLVFASQGSVTLTAQRGTVPVTVINLARYPVRVRVGVSSTRLSFPDATSQTLVVSPQGDTITFVAEARTPGTFPITVEVTSPDGVVRFGSGEVLVRSIAARTPALVLTAGAALFLLAWSGRALLRRRRMRAE